MNALVFPDEGNMAASGANLIVKFRVGGKASVRTRRAARISLDRQTGLTLTDPRSGFLEVIPLNSIEILAIQSLSRPRYA